MVTMGLHEGLWSCWRGLQSLRGLAGAGASASKLTQGCWPQAA